MTSAMATANPAVLMTYGLREPAAYAMPNPAKEPLRPTRIVSHAGIGSGPGTASRASAPVTNPDSSTPMTVPRLTAAMIMRSPRPPGAHAGDP